MEVDMELSKKTTILFSPEQHDRLVRLAKRQGTSLGALVREACQERYGLVSEEERLTALDELRALALPVDTPARMKRESAPEPHELLSEEDRAVRPGARRS